MSIPDSSSPETSNNGSASHVLHHINFTQEDYKPYILQDIAHSKSISFSEFLEHVLGVTTEWKSSNQEFLASISKDARYKVKLVNYGKRMGRETERYAPFIELIEMAQSLLAKRFPNDNASDITFIRNDPIYISGSRSSRKPDIVVVPTNAMVAKSGSDTSSNAVPPKRPQSFPFYWSELFGFFEFKMKNKELKGLPADAAYPRFIPVHQDAVAPNASVSQTDPSSAPEISQSGPGTMMGSTITQAVSETVSLPVTSNTLKRPATSDGKENSDSKKSKPNTTTHSETVFQGTSAEKLDILTQCGSYALELLSCGGFRNYVISALIVDQFIYLLYYDRSIIVVSDPINFMHDHAGFLSMLYGLNQLRSTSWGHSQLFRLEYNIPSQTKPEKRTVSNTTFSDTVIHLKDISLKLSKTLYQQHCLIGRGTLVIQASLQPGSPSVIHKEYEGRVLVVKFSFPATSRQSESVILEHIYARARSLGETFILEHLPNMIYAEDVEQAGILPQEGIKQCFPSYEARQLRVIVQEELSPITNVNKVKAMARIFQDIFKAIRWLYEKAETLHRDISYSNVMFRTLKDGSISGVLNDFDLASSGNHSAPTSQQRTGTKPYMAVDLLCGDNPEHLYRHDLESLFYVMVRHAGRFNDNGQVVENPLLKEWEDQGTDQLCNIKHRFIMSVPKWDKYLTRLYLENFGPCFHNIHQAFRKGFTAREDAKPPPYSHPLSWVPTPEIDQETLGGNVTFDNYGAILRTLSSV